MINRISIPDDPTQIPNISRDYTYADLVQAVTASIEEMYTLIANVPDGYVTFAPTDPEANDPYAEDPNDIHRAWTLGHNLVHYNASGEEVASITSLLARGVEVEQRIRAEVPWQTVKTTQQMVTLLEESKRIRLAYLSAWPTDPNLDTLFLKYRDWVGPMNAIAYGIFGLRHDYSHLDQVAQIIQQAQEQGT